MREENRLLKAKLFGRSTETKKALLKDQQPELFELEETEPELEEDEADDEPATVSRRRKGGKRKPIPDHFPRREVIHDIEDADKICACGTQRKKIGEDVSEQLDVIPAQVEVVRHIRPKYACPGCEGLESTDGTVVIASMPKQMLPKALAGPSLLADIITAKFADAVPFYRNEQRLKRIGLQISRSTMAGWTQKSAETCKPLFELMARDALACNYLQVDETPLRVHREKDKANTALSYIWAIRGEPPPSRHGPVHLFYDSPTRSGIFIKDFLKGYHLKCAIRADAIAQDVGAKYVGKSTGVLGKYVEHFYDMLQPNRLCEGAAKNRSI